MGRVTVEVRVETVCARCSGVTMRKEVLYVRVGKQITVLGDGCDCHEHVLFEFPRIHGVICAECFNQMAIELSHAHARVALLNNQIDNYDKAVKLLAGCMRDEGNAGT